MYSPVKQQITYLLKLHKQEIPPFLYKNLYKYMRNHKSLLIYERYKNEAFPNFKGQQLLECFFYSNLSMYAMPLLITRPLRDINGILTDEGKQTADYLRSTVYPRLFELNVYSEKDMIEAIQSIDEIIKPLSEWEL